MRTRTGITVLMVTLASWATGGPNTISYQGSVLQASGTPVADGAYAMRFSIFTVASGGLQVWQETDTAVSVQNGLFSTTLGDGTAFGSLFANNNNLWLEVEIDLNHSGTFETNEEYAPRQKLAGAAWAMDADTLDRRHATEFSLTTHNHDAVYWRLAGNAGTTSGTHFLGTTDNKPLDLRANNVRALRIEPNAQSPNLIGGYRGNYVTSGVVGATISGGGRNGGVNQIASSYGTIGGGNSNAVVSGVATIGGGEHHTVNGNWSTIGGGFDNEITTYGATIGGGAQSRATGPFSTIGGGNNNEAGGYRSTVGGGRGNQASGHYATIAGGDMNTASGFTATICGGWDNTASGTLATVAGGAENVAGGECSFAAGHNAEANHNGTFVWGDSTGWPSVKSTGDDQFIVRARGGMILTPLTGALNPQAQLHIPYTSNIGRPHLLIQQTSGGDGYARLRLAGSAGATTHFWDVAAQQGTFNIYYHGDAQDILRLLPDDATNLLYMRNGARLTNGGVWTNASDRNAKENFVPVDGRQVLEQVIAMPIQTWNFRAERESARHMGPTAQDFYAAFSLGDSDRSICTVDAEGVALAAIQGLHQIVKEKEVQIATQQHQIQALQQRNANLEERLVALETQMARLAAPQAPGQ